MFQQAYCDVPQARQDCQEFRDFMQKDYNVPDENFFVIENKNLQETKKMYILLH